MSAVDWSRWRKCPVCFSELGEPCMELSGLIAESGPVEVEADRPHGGREMRVQGVTATRRGGAADA